jgi:pyruvate, orthophosphate dikinase
MKHVYSFKEGDGKNKMLLGGKGANLCEMTQIGLNVPPGFVITTATCLEYLAHSERQLPAGVMEQVHEKMAEVETLTGHKFGDASNPLLVSVRSGSAMSMPGMMDTILNLGLNKATLKGLIQQTGNERFGYDAYRRFIQLYGKVALGVPDEKFDVHFDAVKKQAHVSTDVALSATHLKEIGERFLKVVHEHTGRPFPEDVYEQLELAIKAVFNSWSGKRAVDYRREFKITPEMANGTAVNVVAMVFGNMGEDSGTGVGFTRDPGTGENVMYGEYLVNAQGEDVVAGIRTPKAVKELGQEMPVIYEQLIELRNKLENHYREVQDYEYTIEKGVLYCLQTRNGKMNATARVRTAVEMVEEGMISKEEALLRVDPEMLDQLLHPRLDPVQAKKTVALATGLAASPGAAFGKCVFDADRAEVMGKNGEDVILVREETKPEDIHGFFAAKGILTSRGGKTSHAAVVARGMGKPCVAGAEGIEVDVKLKRAIIGSLVLNEGDMITIDGGTGKVYQGRIPTVDPEFSAELKTLLSWADEVATIGVRANADTPDAAQKAVEFGAQGIGLCRTERMFNDVDRLPVVVDMILAETPEKRQTALDKLLPMQRSDFVGIFEAMSPRPVTIRLLDPPLHEFLPTEMQLMDQLRYLEEYDRIMHGKRTVLATLPYLAGMEGQKSNTEETDEELSQLENVIAKKRLMLKKVRELVEANPMLGHRGVRLGMTHPEIYAMQIRAILEAAAECVKKGVEIYPEIMVPQVCTGRELERVKTIVDQLRTEIESTYSVTLEFKFGTMIEVVRACLRADDIADVAEFFSFGTNDLTQATYSFSREDAENKFLPFYNENKILIHNPFEMLDINGVGELMKIAVSKGRSKRQGLKVGICGEQGGHPPSIHFCHKIGLSYVSCSGPRVPIARLAAAQAKLLEAKGGNVREASL